MKKVRLLPLDLPRQNMTLAADCPEHRNQSMNPLGKRKEGVVFHCLPPDGSKDEPHFFTVKMEECFEGVKG